MSPIERTYPAYFTTRCPGCGKRMVYLPKTRVYGYKGRWAENTMTCHRCKTTVQTLDELSLSGGIIHQVNWLAYEDDDTMLYSAGD